jgi:hypothetical protein
MVTYHCRRSVAARTAESENRTKSTLLPLGPVRSHGIPRQEFAKIGFNLPSISQNDGSIGDDFSDHYDFAVGQHISVFHSAICSDLKPISMGNLHMDLSIEYQPIQFRSRHHAQSATDLDRNASLQRTNDSAG